MPTSPALGRIEVPRPSTNEVPAALWPSLLLCALVAVWIDLGHLHRHHCADGIIPIMVSLQKWTPFYWMQARYGMLIPLLAVPFKDPLTNLLVQNGLTAFAGLASFFLVSRYVVAGRHWPLVGAAACASFLFLVPSITCSFYLTPCGYYGPSLSLGVAGLLLAEQASGRARWLWVGVAGCLLLAAHWINLSIVLPLGLLVVARGARDIARPTARSFLKTWHFCRRALRWRRPLVPFVRCLSRVHLLGPMVGLVLLAVAYKGGTALTRLSEYGEPNITQAAPLATWPNLWWGLAREAYDRGGGVIALGMYVACLLFALPIAYRYRKPVDRIRGQWPALALVSAGLLMALLLGTRRWIALSYCDVRYLLPAMVIAHTGFIATAVAAAMSASRPIIQHRLALVLVPLFMAVAAGQYGLPSLATVRGDLDACLGQDSPAVLASGCTHLAGDYWKVWPAVYHATLVRREQGDPAPLWGLAMRSLPTCDQWTALPGEQMRIAVLGSDSGLGDRCWRDYLPELEAEDHANDLTIYRPTPLGTIWRPGFSCLEKDERRSWRWCAARGELRLINTSDLPKRLKFEMQLRSTRPTPSHVLVESDWFAEQREVSCQRGEFARVIDLPPGTHAIHFTCDGKRVIVPDDPRDMVFQVSDFHMTEVSP